MNGRICPNCDLLNSESAKRCKCGYDFYTKKIEKSYLPQEDEEIDTTEEEGIFSKLKDRWFIRYPFAALLLWVAGYILFNESNEWYLAVILALWAAALAKEVSIVLIVIGVGYMILQGIAALPVSIAIIIGALIIAGAMKE